MKAKTNRGKRNVAIAEKSCTDRIVSAKLSYRSRKASRAQYFLDGEICADALRSFLAFVKDDIPDGCEGLDLFIQSVGGSVPVAFAMADFLMSLPIAVRTYNLSNVDSASIIVYAAGEERLVSPNSTFFLHPVCKPVSGLKNAKELRRLADEIEYDARREAKFLSRRTGAAESRWRRIMEEGATLDGTQAVELGLATSCKSIVLVSSLLTVGRGSKTANGPSSKKK